MAFVSCQSIDNIKYPKLDRNFIPVQCKWTRAMIRFEAILHPFCFIWPTLPQAFDCLLVIRFKTDAKIFIFFNSTLATLFFRFVWASIIICFCSCIVSKFYIVRHPKKWKTIGPVCRVPCYLCWAVLLFYWSCMHIYEGRLVNLTFVHTKQCIN